MPYITQAQIEAIVPPPVLTDALDDDQDGQRDPGMLDQIIANASNACDALICSRYAVPFATPPASLSRAALCLAVAMIYGRREVPDEKLPPEAKEAKQWRDYLRQAGMGEVQLDIAATVPLLAQGGGNAYVPGRVPLPDSTGNLTTDY